MQQGCEAAQNKELVYMPREAQHKSVLEFYWAPLHGLLRLSTWTACSQVVESLIYIRRLYIRRLQSHKHARGSKDAILVFPSRGRVNTLISGPDKQQLPTFS